MTTTTAPAAAPAKLPGSLEANKRISQWIKISAAGTVEVSPGKVDIGQGITTALTQIAADELGVKPERIRMIRASTAFSPDEGVTSGSQSIQESGTAIRWVCAEVRAIFLAAAAEKLGVPAEKLKVEDGSFLGEGNLATSYWELADPSLLDRNATATAKPLPSAARKNAGSSMQRVDIPDKVFGRRRFIHDQNLDGVLHGRVVRPARPGAKVKSLDETNTKAMPGVVAIVRDGDFLGVVAETEHAVIKASERLARDVAWEGGFTLPSNHDLKGWLMSQPAETTISAKQEGKPSA